MKYFLDKGNEADLIWPEFGQDFDRVPHEVSLVNNTAIHIEITSKLSKEEMRRGIINRDYIRLERGSYNGTV